MEERKGKKAKGQENQLLADDRNFMRVSRQKI